MKKLVLSLSAVAVSSALMLTPAKPDGAGFVLEFSKDVYIPGETALLTVSAEPGTISWLGFDFDPGPTLIPGIGELSLGFSSSFQFAPLPVMPPEGFQEFTWVCSNPCTNPITGNDMYIQGIAIDPVTMSLCVSNVEVLNVEDLFETCESQGCTPGYWKNHTEDWAEAGLSPDQDWDTVFGVDYFDPDVTLLQSMNPSDNWVFAAHSTAALLNASHPGADYELLPSEIIQIVQDAVASGDDSEIEAAKDLFDHLNNTGCPF